MIATLMLAQAMVATIDYRVSVTPGPAVTVEMTFPGDDDGETDIDLPEKWAGSAELWRGLKLVSVAGGEVVKAPDPAHWRIRHIPGARLRLRYTVADGQPGAPDAGTFEKARPVIERDWLSIHNQGVIAVPQGRENAPATFAFGPVASGWQVVSDLTAPARPLTANEVAEGVIVGGVALRIETRAVGGKTLRVAILGRWPFADAALADPVARLMASENATLGAPAVNYLVTLIPLTGSASGAVSSGGTGATAGFALEATDNVPLRDLTRTLAHEYGHRWFGRAFGPNEDSARGYLFSEGFNDWFAHRAMVTSGLWTPADWADQLDLVLLRYGSSTAREMSEAEIIAKFWENPDAMQLQYDRGNLTALLLDTRLRAGWKPGLIDLLRRMDEAEGDERARIEALAEAALPGSFAAAAKEALTGLPDDALVACGTVAWREQPAYGRGFDIDDARKVTKVELGSGAEKAGIRPGMTYKRRISFTYLDASKPYVAEFVDGGATRTISWLPALAKSVRFQKLKRTGIDTPACRSAIAGTVGTP
jgi:predicted metalloprotease with PDZ domain